MTTPANYQDYVATHEQAALRLKDISINYKAKRGIVHAVRNISLHLNAGESLALIGESGSGKSTLALGIVRLLVKSAEISSGKVIYQRDGKTMEVLSLQGDALRRFRWAETAMVFQAALNAFNPVLRIWQQIWDTAKAHGWRDKKAVRKKAMELLDLVQLDAERVIDLYPHELSGGMRQRVLIALALMLDPQVIILDEPTTALDILTQRTIINLLRDLKAARNFTMLFISHNLAIAAELANRIATMYAGTIVEIGPTDEIFYHPRHPYTLGLIRAVPTVTGGFEKLESIPGSPPDLIDLPTGCKFHPRCAFATERCRLEEPVLEKIDEDHYAACWHWRSVNPKL